MASTQVESKFDSQKIKYPLADKKEHGQLHKNITPCYSNPLA